MRDFTNLFNNAYNNAPSKGLEKGTSTYADDYIRVVYSGKLYLTPKGAKVLNVEGGDYVVVVRLTDGVIIRKMIDGDKKGIRKVSEKGLELTISVGTEFTHSLDYSESKNDNVISGGEIVQLQNGDETINGLFLETPTKNKVQTEVQR